LVSHGRNLARLHWILKFQDRGLVAEEVQLNWSRWIRQTHRWLSVVFTVAVIINGVTVIQRRYNNKLGLSAVAILALLLLTGLYLFVLPYVNKWRG
jgi:hypothetical protein